MIKLTYVDSGLVQKGEYQVRRTINVDKPLLHGIEGKRGAPRLIDADLIDFRRQIYAFSGLVPTVNSTNYIKPDGTSTSNKNVRDAVLDSSGTPRPLPFGHERYGLPNRKEIESIVIPSLVPTAIFSIYYYDDKTNNKFEKTIVLPLDDFANIATQCNTKAGMTVINTDLSPVLIEDRQWLKHFGGKNEFRPWRSLTKIPAPFSDTQLDTFATISSDNFTTADGNSVTITRTSPSITGNNASVNVPLFLEPQRTGNYALPPLSMVYLQGFPVEKYVNLLEGDSDLNINKNGTKDFGKSGVLLRYHGGASSEHYVSGSHVMKRRGHEPNEYEYENNNTLNDKGTNQPPLNQNSDAFGIYLRRRR